VRHIVGLEVGGTLFEHIDLFSPRLAAFSSVLLVAVWTPAYPTISGLGNDIQSEVLSPLQGYEKRSDFSVLHIYTQTRLTFRS
jgi:predicted small secreted protein